jgi:hypothetical protein
MIDNNLRLKYYETTGFICLVSNKKNTEQSGEQNIM